VGQWSDQSGDDFHLQGTGFSTGEVGEAVDGSQRLGFIARYTFEASVFNLPVEHTVGKVFGAGPWAMCSLWKVAGEKSGSGYYRQEEKREDTHGKG
jgi:hypothetical protein